MSIMEQKDCFYEGTEYIETVLVGSSIMQDLSGPLILGFWKQSE